MYSVRIDYAGSTVRATTATQCGALRERVVRYIAETMLQAKYAYFLNHVNRAKNSEWSGSPKCLFHKILTPNKIMYFLSGFVSNIMQLSSKRLSRFS